MNFSMLEKYASPFKVYSDLSPQGRAEKGFIQPLVMYSDSHASPDKPGFGGNKYLLIASHDAISADEKHVRVAFSGALFRVLRREEYGMGKADHIECLLRYLGREEYA